MIRKDPQNDDSLLDTIRIGVAIALAGPLVGYSLYLLLTGTALVDLPFALLDAAAQSALDSLQLMFTHPVRGIAAIAVMVLLSRFAFTRRRR